MAGRARYDRVLCLEGDWDGELTSRSSVLPMLELLARIERIEFVHKDVGTRAELVHYLRQWLDHDHSVADYSTLYLAFHGDVRTKRAGGQRVLWLSDADDGEISLDELATVLGTGLKDVVIHFGSCSVLAERDEVLGRFLDMTGVKAVAGYTTDVEWVPSAAMDLLFFDAIAGYTKWAAAQKALAANQSLQSLRKALGFRIFPA